MAGFFAKKVTIAASATLSPKTSLPPNSSIVGFKMPPAFTGIALTFLVGAFPEDPNYYPLYDSAGNLISIDVLAARSIWPGETGVQDFMMPLLLVNHFQLRSAGAANADAVEAAARDIYLLLRQG